ncbi:hypothetical protein [Prevotella sp.]|uniref:hypothetical protein n=1 Tax=Prevotella sp. TaxID=59823 RepID=UPI0027E233E9|nr:hypothetical protein [Prevotella sp.]
MMQKELIQVLRKILDFSYQELFITLANIQKVQEKKHTHCKKKQLNLQQIPTTTNGKSTLGIPKLPI